MKLFKRQQGQAMVEMALVIPLFLLLMFGVIEMGRIGHTYVTVSNAARSGVRVATAGGSDQDIITAVSNAAPSLNAAQLTTNISPPEASRQSGQSVQVQVTYPVQLIIPILSSVLPNPIVVRTTLSMRVE